MTPKIEITPQNPEIENGSILEPLILNEGLQHLPSKILRLLDTRSLANCRLVSRQFRDIIDRERQLLILQSNQALHQPFISLGEIQTLAARKPHFKAVVDHFTTNEDSKVLQMLVSILKKFVKDSCGFSSFLSIHCFFERNYDFLEALVRSPYVPEECEVSVACDEPTGDFLPMMLKFMKARKMDINQKINRMPLLHIAVVSPKQSAAKKVKLLLENAEELNLDFFVVDDLEEETALELAERLGKNEIVALLKPFYLIE